MTCLFVIPAKAGIHKCVKYLDSRFRGNDTIWLLQIFHFTAMKGYPMKKLLVLALLAVATLIAPLTHAASAAKEPGPALSPSTTRQFTSASSLPMLGGAEVTIVAPSADEVKAMASIASALSESSATAAALMAETKVVNDAPRKTAVPVSEKFVKVIERCKNFSALTDNAFDITGATEAGSVFTARNSRQLKTDMGAKTLTIKADDVQIDPSAFAVALKGFIADDVIESFKTQGWTSAQIKIDNISRSIGSDIHTPWTIQVDAPTEAERGKSAFRAYNYSVSDIATAIVSPRVFPQGIMDPRTRTLVDKPAIINAIVFASDAATATAYAIAAYANSAKSADAGLAFVQSHPEIKGIIIGLDGNVIKSKGLTINQAHYESMAHDVPTGDLGPADSKLRAKEDK